MTLADRINGPGPERVGSDRYQRQCIDALEPSIMSVIEAATSRGWDPQQALLAVMCIVVPNVTDETLVQAGALVTN